MLFAYIDPALGSMLLQGIAGMFLAAAIMGRRILFAPLEWLHLKRPEQGENSTESAAEKNPDQHTNKTSE